MTGNPSLALRPDIAAAVAQGVPVVALETTEAGRAVPPEAGAISNDLDALAAGGTRFDNCFTPTAICTPARASLLTGCAPFRHKLLANYERNVGYLEDLAPGQFTFAERLAERGYSEVTEVESARESLLFALPPELRRDLRAAGVAEG